MGASDVKKVAANLGMLFRQSLLILADILLINAGYWLMALLSDSPMRDWIPMLLDRTLPVTLGYLVVFAVCGMYSGIWKYAGLHDLLRCFVGGALGGLLSVSIDKIGSYFGKSGGDLAMGNFPAAYYVSSTLLIIALCGGFRLLYRMGRYIYRDGDFGKRRRSARVMILGAGDMGMIIVHELEANGYRKGRPVVIVDDNPSKQGRRFSGIPVRGGMEKIPELAERYKIDEIIYCIPSATSARQVEIMNLAMKT